MRPPRKCVTTQARAAERSCPVCAANFIPARAWQRVCSPRCRQRAYLERRIADAVATKLRETASQAPREAATHYPAAVQSPSSSPS